MKILLACAALTFTWASSAQADIEVRFFEGAPKDRFEFKSTTDCAGPVTLSLDLAPSAGALIFDVTSAGGGVEVFQPFELVSGGSLVSSSPSVKDGDTTLAMTLGQMPKGTAVSFTIDLDDTLSDRQITVNGSEIAGATVSAMIGDQKMMGVFGTNARAVIQTPACAL